MKKNSIQKLNESIDQLLQQDEKPLSFSEAAEYLDVSKSHLYKLTSQAKIPHFKPNKRLYFYKIELTEWTQEKDC